MADGTIDNLNFEVILTDDKFRAKMKEDIALATQFNTELSKILDFKKDIGSGIKIIKTETKKDVKDVEDGMKKVKDETKKAKDTAKDLSSEYKTQSGILRELGSLAGAYFSVRGVEKFLSSLIRVTGEFEVQKMALTSMLGSAETADQIFSTLRQSALESPYTFQELTKYAKQLTAFNIDADKLVETEKMLADVSAGLGVDMGRIILAYGQVKAAGVLKGTELRQFTEAGVPLLQSLADQLSRTEGKAIALSEVFSRISKKEIPFEMVEQAFRDMTSEGGKFYNMQEVLVQTLQGKIGKLRDVWQQALYDMGNANSSTLKGAVDFLTKIASHIDFIVKLLAPLVAGMGTYAAISAIAWSAAKAQAIGTMVKQLWALVRGTQAATAAVATLGSATSALAGVFSVAVGAAVAIALAANRIAEAHNNAARAQKIVEKTSNDYTAAISREKESAKFLVNELSRLEKGTEDYNTVKDAILKNYGQYLSDMDKEKIAAGDLVGVYDNLSTSIEKAAKARFLSEGSKSLEDEFFKAQDKIAKRVTKIAKGDPELAGELMDYIRGDKSKFDLSGTAVAMTTYGMNGLSYTYNAIQQLIGQYGAAKAAYDKGIERLNAMFGEQKPIESAIAAPGSESAPWNPKGWRTTTDNSATRAIENQINLLRTFKQAYDDLAKSGMSGGEAEKFLLNIFPDFADIIKTADFDKAITAELEKLKTLDPEAYKNLALALGNEGLAKALKELAEAGKENKTVEPLSQSQIDKLAAVVFKDKTSHLSMKGYKNKSVFSIADIIKELKDLELTAKDLDADTLEKIKNGQLTLKDLQKTFEKMRKEKTAEAAGALAQHFKILAKGIADLADSLVAYGEAGGNEFAKGLGEAINELSGLASSVAQGFSQGGWVGGIVAGVVYIGKVLLEDLTYMEELQNRISSAQVQKWAKDMNSILGSGDGFFGENGLQKIRSSAEVATKALEKLQTATAKINAGTNIKTADKSWISNAFGWLVRARTGNKAVASLFADQVRTLGDVASQLGYELYNENGIINSEALQAILDTYDKLGSKDRQWMEEAIVYAEEYKTALDALDEVTQSIFGDLASSAADAIVESWATAGDAALDYADILDDVAKRYAKMLVQSTLIDSVLTPDFKNELNALVGGGDVEGAMAKVVDGMARIQAMAPQIQEILSPLVPYLNGNESGAESSLGNGIKSITEDTANLLAAYINGIRADVAAGNSQRAEILALVREYVGAGSAPSYTEYLTQIEAHTANLAANTNAILSELRSIITPESGLPAVRVQTA